MTTENIEPTEGGHRARVMVENELGLHLRPASKLVKLTNLFESCEISLTKDGQTINAKSIMGVIMLAAEKGCYLLVEASGNGSREAVEALVRFVTSGFEKMPEGMTGDETTSQMNSL